MLLLLALACASKIPALYEAERAAALARRPTVEGDWDPQLRLRIGSGALRRAAEEVVAAGVLGLERTWRVDTPLGIPLEAQPGAHVDKLVVRVGRDCGGCLAVDATVTGAARWTVGPAKGRLPFTARVAGTLAFDTEPADQGWRVTGRLVDLGRVKVQAGDAGSVDLSPFLGDWIGDALAEAPPLQLGVIGGAKLPLRGLRIAGDGQAIELLGLTDVPDAVPVAADAGRLERDWSLRLHPDTVVALMRRGAFQRGPGRLGIAVDPRSLAVEDDRFTLGLRIWRLEGGGWWRDYEVEGALGVEGQRIRFRGTEAREGDKSPGAGLADPLALLVEGRILDEVEKGVDHAIPGSRTLPVRGVRVSARAQAARGEPGALVVEGALSLATPEGDGRKGRR